MASRDKRPCAYCGRPFQPQRSDAITCSDRCRKARLRRLAANTPTLSLGQFDLIMADPPWHYDTRTPAGQGRSPSRHYPTMDIAAICRLPICEHAADNAALALWVYNPRLFDADRVAAAWGFSRYSGVLFTLIKRTKKGDPGFGQGHTTRKASEQCLLFTRGKGLRRADAGVREVIELDEPEVVGTPRLAHSEKPDEAAHRLEALFGPVRRLELFARKRRAGWTCWGHDLDPASPLPSVVEQQRRRRIQPVQLTLAAAIEENVP